MGENRGMKKKDALEHMTAEPRFCFLLCLGFTILP